MWVEFIALAIIALGGAVLLAAWHSSAEDGE